MARLTNGKLDRTELHVIFEDGRQEAHRLERRLQAIILKLATIGAEVEDEHTSQIVLHMGQRGDVKVDFQKRY